MNGYVVGTKMTNRHGLEPALKEERSTCRVSIPHGSFKFARSVADMFSQMIKIVIYSAGTKIDQTVVPRICREQIKTDKLVREVIVVRFGVC